MMLEPCGGVSLSAAGHCFILAAEAQVFRVDIKPARLEQVSAQVFDCISWMRSSSAS